MSDKKAAFLFGLGFAIILLLLAVWLPDPTRWQEFVFRTILSLVAAGIGSRIPGMLELRWPWLKAGGALALFALVFLVNPPAIIRDTTASFKSSQGDSALNIGNYPLADQLFQQAKQINSESWEAQVGLAKVAFRTGEYERADKLYQELLAFPSLLGPLNDSDISMLKYQRALCLDGAGKIDDLIKALIELESESASDTWQHVSAIFDRGVAHLILAIGNWPSVDEVNIQASEDAFNEYSVLPNQPQEWLQYHRACLQALRARGDETAKRSAIAQFDNALGEIKSLRLPIRLQQMKLLREVMSEGYTRFPGYPVECPPLKLIINELEPTRLSRL
ncbi:tetratricopeptide (TPR) repeat protein [Rhizobium leguminosarum]|uniref:hypothetical protein n=1 Tax=Rhizobium leguminosarum TaxID=384 RepID=UPI0016139C21|nr:hypothetical protein [Rhizobium leguminosarum]MBB4587942.1 tetratricopeptide (TPR) repeat protein [Rhizobium leguminosarum]